MYYNADLPPASKPIRSGIDTGAHLRRLGRMASLLAMSARARGQAENCLSHYKNWSPAASPFHDRGKWLEDHYKWLNVCRRLDKYYYKNLCELNSMAYNQLLCPEQP